MNENFQNQERSKNDKNESSNKENIIKEETNKIIEWVILLKDMNQRENALVELSKKRESFPDLAIYLWYSAGTVASL
jgi:CCR4-NOT transcription complex subunit 9